MTWTRENDKLTIAPVELLTWSLLFSSAGRTSLTVLSTSTPPIIRKHRLSGSTPFKASITILQSGKSLVLLWHEKLRPSHIKSILQILQIMKIDTLFYTSHWSLFLPLLPPPRENNYWPKYKYPILSGKANTLCFRGVERWGLLVTGAYRGEGMNIWEGVVHYELLMGLILIRNKNFHQQQHWKLFFSIRKSLIQI